MTNISKSIILNTDSYKCSQWVQYPPGTEYVYSYIESRGGAWDKTLFFGLQAFLKEYMTQPVTMADIDFAEQIITAHGEPFNRAGWEYIVKEHKGLLPVTIAAVDEGLVIPTKNVLVAIVNTDPKCFWLTSYVETALLRAVWYPTTVATNSWHIKQLILKYLEATGTPESIDFKLHDFAARGVSSFETAGLGGMAHLVNFKGTDTITGLIYARQFYNESIAGFSIPASEHSTIVSWGKDRESDAYKNMLDQFGKEGLIFACVSDSYDIYNAAKNIWGHELKQQIIDSKATLVIRPDSGDPLEVNLKLIRILADQFGYTVNEKGFKVLNNVRIIQGDGVDELSISSILGGFMALGWSADNIAFGMGGALSQKVNRDTSKFAQKASAVRINGAWYDVFKDPVTDPGKTSKKGLVQLWENNGNYVTSVEPPKGWADTAIGDWSSSLKEVFTNGIVKKEYTFEEVRANSRK